MAMYVSTGRKPPRERRRKVDLEKFMIETHQKSGMTFNTFHTMFRYVNERYFGRTLYQQIKSNQISADEVAALLKGAM
jgi:hypothetical protein